MRSREGMNILLNFVRSRVGSDEALFERYSGFLSSLSDLRHERIVRSVSMNETVPLPEKLAFFSRIPITASIGLEEGLRNTLVLIMMFDLWAQLPTIVSAAREDYFRRTGQVEVLIQAASVLSETEKSEVLTRLSDQFDGQKIRPVWSDDPTLLAGLVLRKGTRVWDGSLKGRLARIELDLLRA